MAAEREENGVSYIPDQPDPLGVAVTEAVRRGPFALAVRDLITAVRMFALFPGVILPLWTVNPQDEFYLSWGPNVLGLALLSFATIPCNPPCICYSDVPLSTWPNIHTTLRWWSNSASPYLLSYARPFQNMVKISDRS